MLHRSLIEWWGTFFAVKFLFDSSKKLRFAQYKSNISFVFSSNHTIFLSFFMKFIDKNYSISQLKFGEFCDNMITDLIVTNQFVGTVRAEIFEERKDFL